MPEPQKAVPTIRTIKTRHKTRAQFWSRRNRFAIFLILHLRPLGANEPLDITPIGNEGERLSSPIPTDVNFSGNNLKVRKEDFPAIREISPVLCPIVGKYSSFWKLGLTEVFLPKVLEEGEG